jgi:hypothetical protein
MMIPHSVRGHVMSSRNALVVCLLLGLALGCGSTKDPGGAGGSGGSSAAGGSGGGPSGGKGTFAAVNGIAKMIYDAVAAGEDVTPHIEGVFEALGVPVLASDDASGAQARIAAGLPVMTESLAARMSEAYQDGVLVDAKGVFEGLVEQGVKLGYPYNLGGDPLSADLFGALMYSSTVVGDADPDQQVLPGYVLPALVRALGQERVRRTSGTDTDPAWGDGRLDPLQFTLVTYSILTKGGTTGSKSGSGLRASHGLDAAGFIKDKIKDQIEDQFTGQLQDALEVPLDKTDAAKISLCGSLILYGHKVSMKNTPDLLWHAPKTPNVTQVELTLTFEDDFYDNWARAVLGSAVTDLTGCKFPRKGPIGGKPVEWDVSAALHPHGAYDLMSSMTNDDGKALASWRTVKDPPLPPACMVFEKQRDAVGATEGVIRGLLPGWSTLERAVTFLNPNTGSQGNAPLTVLYYEVSTDDPCHNQ